MNLNTKAGIAITGLHVAFEAPDLTVSEAIRRLEKLGNPILGTDGTVIVSVDEEYPEVEGQLVWMCDFCRGRSKSKDVVEKHEEVCENNPNKDKQ